MQKADGILGLTELLDLAERESSDAPPFSDIIGNLPDDSRLLSFGQTVCWDEPMKAVLFAKMHQIGVELPFIFGVHDTDYFSKVHASLFTDEPFAIVKRNDGSMANIWTATCEIALPFGSEATPTVANYNACGIPMSKLARHSGGSVPEFIDKWTEAWGWRAIVHNSRRGPVAAFVRIGDVIERVMEILSWAFNGTAEMVDGADYPKMAARALLKTVDEFARKLGSDAPLSSLYIHLYKSLLNMLLGSVPKNFEATTSLRFFQFNSSTCMRNRFKPLDIFLSPDKRGIAKSAYDEAVTGSGIYTLSKFGEHALPFDLVYKGFGRGTICVDGNWLLILGADGRRVETKACEALTDRMALARCIENSFGSDCALVGKAIITPIMLCSEGIMVLSETGSAYMHITKRFVKAINEAGIQLELFPLLRVYYSTFDAMRHLKIKLNLPEHIARFIGSQTISAEEFALSWRDIVKDARRTTESMVSSQSPASTFELLKRFDMGGGEHEQLRWEFEAAAIKLQKLGTEIEGIIRDCRQLAQKERSIVAELSKLSLQSAELKRKVYFSTLQDESSEIEICRTELKSLTRKLSSELMKLRRSRMEVVRRLKELAYSDDAERLRSTKFRLTLKLLNERLSLARDALLTAALPYSDFRPCAWWLCMLDEKGKWWHGIMELARARFEKW